MSEPSLKGGPPHVLPAITRRPHGAHRYWVSSPKAGRRIVLFGVATLECWIELEADARITTLCERPVVIPEAPRRKTADFWVSGPNLNEYILIENGTRPRGESRTDQLPYPAFRAWAAEFDCGVRILNREESSNERQIWYGNWTQILQHLSSYRQYVAPDCLSCVREVVASRLSIEKVIQLLVPFNDELIRAAIYTLVHKGAIRIVDIEKERLSDLTEVEPA